MTNISLRDLAPARIKAGECSRLSDGVCFASEGAVYIPKERRVILVRNFPIPDDPPAVTSVEYVEHCLEIAERDKHKKPEQRKALILNNPQDLEIPTNHFDKNRVTRWAFQDQAAKYGCFLRNSTYDIQEISILFDSLDNKDGPPFTRRLRLCRLGYCDGSGIGCNRWILGTGV